MAAATRELGMSRDRLRRLGDAMRRGVDDAEIPGAVLMVGRRGETAVFESCGYRDREAGAVMGGDTIFRIASMTKPLTSLAAMILVEEGRFHLSDPVSAYLPALKDLNVGVEKPDGGLDLEPCRRVVTILDLFRHTSGFTYGWLGRSAVKRLYQAAGIDQFPGNATEYVAKIAELPLQFQPGAEWGYGVSTDILGHVVEAVSGDTLEAFVASRITEPLKMPDTGFWVDATKRDRLAQPQIDPATGNRPPMADRTLRPARFGGGGAMLSTASDYARFCQFWLNGGALDGARLISRKTAELMTADHLPPEIKGEQECLPLFGPWLPVPEYGSGFALGFAVRTAPGRAPWHGSVGDLGWMGSSGCVFWIDPKESLFAILLMQAPAQLERYAKLMRSLVYQAVAD
jgi:CubicO group peptidase (beta-lactamase class C family)